MDTLSSSKTWIGVVVAIAGNVTISLALNCQKLAHTRLQRGQNGQQDGHSDDSEDGSPNRRPSSGQRRSDRSESSGQNGHANSHSEDGHNGHGKSDDSSSGTGMDTMFLHSKLWWLGLALMTIGEGGNFISYGFAPASLVAPLGAVALLSNVIISPILLGERFKISDIGGILLAIIGAVTVVFSSKQNDVRLDPSELLQAIKRLEFVIYSAISIGVGALLAFTSATSLGDRWVLIDVGICAIFGGFTVLSTKGISSLISGGQPIEALKFSITYVLVVVLAVTAVVQITYLNRALQRFDSREVIPTQFVFFTISAIVGSAILYRDFENMDAHRLINFLFGCLTTFGGVFVLTWRHGEANGKQTDEESGEDSADESVEEDEEPHGEDPALNERSLLLSHPSSTSTRGRISSLASTASRTKPRQRIDFIDAAAGPSNALRVPSSSSGTKLRRPRSRTSSPHKMSTSFDRTSAYSRSASNQPAGVLSSSSSAGLRTPKLGLMSIDRPTGLSSGHYLLLATPPPSFTLQPVAPAGPAGRSGLARGYGAAGRSNPAGLLPLPVTTPGSEASTGQEETEAPTSQPTAAETIAAPVVETAGTIEEDLEGRLLDHVTAGRSDASGSR
ncbi:Magnesium transporter NIPA [Kalmanozyma brasiliensis GHG001]|uniref:Magnesium transporter NIPA n=1 Tax=Kalmanozyma brasiliensis (strain GHG001) TaxID=1365824 RepID=UPI002867F3C4|nr:Magnesium transporter NIPA [Kalmanozyma brasiliensis GHG001]EST05831.2 Magnesium transporter NIPA [Kalmanozyma brasiliensis GHG001]